MSEREYPPQEPGDGQLNPAQSPRGEYPPQGQGNPPVPGPRQYPQGSQAPYPQGQGAAYPPGQYPRGPQAPHPQGQYPRGPQAPYPQGSYPPQGQRAPYPQGQNPQGQVPQVPYPQYSRAQDPRGQQPPYPQVPRAYPPGHPNGVQPGVVPSTAVAARPRRPVWPWLVGGGAVVAIGLIAALTIPPLLAPPSGPIAATPDVTIFPADPSPTADPGTPSDWSTVAESTPAEDDMAAVFAERDAFFAAQQQPMDGSELTPKTPDQQQFIDDQTAWVEQQGGTVTSQAVSIWLALAIDGCETAILNAHDVDSSIFAMHVSTSPLISALVAQSDNPDAEPNLAQTMVFGMGYICPSDGAQWSTLWDEAYDG
ncbi:hypothetical protein [Microbacterium gorillae]|uniref:hypothetical protein n=1 Tax=Microbacterium gorillae TaxID=1231063 RepID=UPI003D975279